MANAVIMPRQGQSVESCILTEWYKSVGDSVTKGDLLFAYETDKAAFEEEAPEDGILLVRFYEEGDEVPVLLNVAVIGAEGDDIEAFRPEGGAAEVADPVTKPELTMKTEVSPSVMASISSFWYKSAFSTAMAAWFARIVIRLISSAV